MKGLFEITGNAKVIHDQPIGFIGAYTVHASDSLQEFMVFDAAIKIQSLYNGRIKAGDEHTAYTEKRDRIRLVRVSMMQRLFEILDSLLVLVFICPPAPIYTVIGELPRPWLRSYLELPALRDRFRNVLAMTLASLVEGDE